MYSSSVASHIYNSTGIYLLLATCQLPTANSPKSWLNAIDAIYTTTTVLVLVLLPVVLGSAVGNQIPLELL
jgi:hypothetical protein